MLLKPRRYGQETTENVEDEDDNNDNDACVFDPEEEQQVVVQDDEAAVVVPGTASNEEDYDGDEDQNGFSSPMKPSVQSLFQTTKAKPTTTTTDDDDEDGETTTSSNSESDTYLDMFWMDAIPSKTGDIITLYGKVKTNNTNGSDNDEKTTTLNTPQYSSIAVQVQNNIRNLFVLPRPASTMLQVHTEIQNLLQPNIVPNKAGSSWAVKVVKRKYASSAFPALSINRISNSIKKLPHPTRYTYR